MNKSLKIPIIAVLGFIGILGVTLWILSQEDPDMIDLDMAKAEVLNDIEKVKEMESEVYDLIALEDTDAAYLEHQIESVMEKHQTKEGTVDFFISSLMLDDPELFVQAFDPAVISRDLFDHDNPDKVQVAAEFIKDISREGSIDQAGVRKGDSVLGLEQDQMELVIFYKDGDKVKIDLSFIKASTHHDDHAIYFISTPPSEIIKQSKKH